MKTITATLDGGRLLLNEELPHWPSPVRAFVVLEEPVGEKSEIPVAQATQKPLSAEEEFEIFGLRDWFGDPVDEQVDWEEFFGGGSK